VLAAEYRTVLPKEPILVAEIEKTIPFSRDAPRGNAQGRQEDGEPSRTMISRFQSSKRAAR
jgi:hypothetical protein